LGADIINVLRARSARQSLAHDGGGARAAHAELEQLAHGALVE
jgi:hypothetical protein